MQNVKNPTPTDGFFLWRRLSCMAPGGPTRAVRDDLTIP